MEYFEEEFFLLVFSPLDYACGVAVILLRESSLVFCNETIFL
jgi:hypothetical protein